MSSTQEILESLQRLIGALEVQVREARQQCNDAVALVHKTALLRPTEADAVIIGMGAMISEQQRTIEQLRAANERLKDLAYVDDDEDDADEDEVEDVVTYKEMYEQTWRQLDSVRHERRVAVDGVNALEAEVIELKRALSDTRFELGRAQKQMRDLQAAEDARYDEE